MCDHQHQPEGERHRALPSSSRERVLSFQHRVLPHKTQTTKKQTNKTCVASHQQWLAWFTVGNRLSNGAVLKYFEVLDIAASSKLLGLGEAVPARCPAWFSVSPTVEEGITDNSPGSKHAPIAIMKPQSTARHIFRRSRCGSW